MQFIKKSNIRTLADARQHAIDWQNWQSTQSLSYSEICDWQAHFTKLAEQYPELKEEFIENGII